MNTTGMNRTMLSRYLASAFLLYGTLLSHAENITHVVLSDTFNNRPLGALVADGGWTTAEPTTLRTKRKLEVITDSGNLMGGGTSNQILFFQNIAANPGTYITTLAADHLSTSSVFMVRFDFYETAGTTGGITIKIGGDPNAANPVNEFTLTDGTISPSGSYSTGAAHHLDAIFNESGTTLSYDDPAGGTSSLETGLMDLWIDNTRVAAGVTQGRSSSPSTQLSSVFLTSDGSNQEIYFDQFEVLDKAINESALPQILSFTASDDFVESNTSISLDWATTQATYTRIDPSIGEVALSGNTHFVITAPTTFTLMASNELGVATSQVFVDVAPAITNLVLGAGTIKVEWNQPSDHFIVVSASDPRSLPSAGKVEASATNTPSSSVLIPYTANSGFFQVMFGMATIDQITSPPLQKELKIQSPVNAPTNAVYDVDLEGVIGMTLPGQEITLAELGELENLDKLSLAGSGLTTLGDLSMLDGITWLNLSSNQLTSTSALGTLTSLEALDLQNNLITDLSGIESLTRLRWLDLENNQITDLAGVVTNAAAGGLGQGDDLWVRGNPLSSTATNQIQTLETTYKVKVHYQ